VSFDHDTHHTPVHTLDCYKQYQHAQSIQKNEPGTCFYGQLTDTGKRNMMSLGAGLRHLYVHQLHFLDKILNRDDIYARSTDYSRTIESVQYLLAGLYPSDQRPPQSDIVLHIRSL
jgi:acid phosphatase